MPGRARQLSGTETKYKTLSAAGEAELVVKRSRFIAHSMNVCNEVQAEEKIAEIKKKYYDASHNVYAYVIRSGNIARCSDDGEPSKTSGASVLSVITGEGLTDTLVVVTRYFGGTLLGAGGLVRAYGQATKMGIENAGITVFTLCGVYNATIQYPDWGSFQHIAQKFNAATSAAFSDNISCDVSIGFDNEQAFLNTLDEVFNKRITINKTDENWVNLSH